MITPANIYLFIGRLRQLAPWLLAVALLVTHAIGAWRASRQLSPVWDEIVNPAAGLAQWKTGSIVIERQHPFLGKLICSLPLVFTQARPPFDHESFHSGDQFRFGFQFTYRGPISFQTIIQASRSSMVFLSIGLGIILFLWLNSLWGPWGGLAGLTTYLATPILTARASLALLEMPQYFFLVLTLFFWTMWVKRGSQKFFLASCLAGGFALGSKSTSLIPLGVIVVAEMFRPMPNNLRVKRAVRALCWGAGVAGVFFLLYAPWGQAGTGLREALSFPFRFGQGHNLFFFAGETLLKPPSVLTWVAFFLKAPPFVWGLGVLGGWSWFRSKKESWLWATLVGMAGAMMAAVFFMATALSTVQISIVYLALAALAGGVTTLPRGKIGRIFIVCLGLAALGETLLVHPHQLAYFNWFAGGSTRGYRWLADSDQDWGQWLPDLKDYWVGQGRPDLLLAYSGPADPSAYGLSFQDLISSALYVRDSREIALPQQPGRLLLATGTKMLQSEPRFFGWLKHNVQPIAQPDPCFFVYDLTDNAEALRWMAAIYNETARPTKAEWAIARADLIEKNHSF